VRADIPGALFYPDEHHLHTSHTLDALHAACRDISAFLPDRFL